MSSRAAVSEQGLATGGAWILHALGGASLASLDRLQASGALAAGKVNVIALDAVAGKLGARWGSRQSLTYEHIERALDRSIGRDGFYCRISDTEYLVAQPNLSQPSGQLNCLNCLRQTLLHFLGEALTPDIRVHSVTRIGSEGVYGARLDVEAVEKAGTAAPEAGEEVSAMASRSAPFVASNGQRVRVSCALEPVFQLKTSQRIGYRVARRVLSVPTEVPLSADEVRRLSSSDIERIDFATIERGLGRLRDGGSAKEPSLILPVSFVTLSSGRGRSVLFDLFKAAKDSVKLGLICEVCDIEGVPQGALLSAISLIRPFSLYVFGRLHEPPSGELPSLKGARLQGLSMECPRSLTGDAEFIGWAKSTRAAARPVGKSAILYRVPSVRHAAIASVLGATHGSLRPAV